MTCDLEASPGEAPGVTWRPRRDRLRRGSREGHV